MKKAIDWLALVVGVALALLGARWMWTGWDIVQAERGWAAVIAGSVMLSGGLIVATLAWTIMRLSGAPAGERQEAAAGTEKPSLFRKPSILAPAAAVVAGAGAIAATAGAALARDAAPDEDAQTPPKDAAQEPLPSPLPPPLPPTAPPTVGELLRMSEDRAARDSHDKHFEEPEAAIAPPVEEAKAESPASESLIVVDDEDEDEEEAPEASDETPELATADAAEKPAPVLPPIPPPAPSPRESEPPPAPLRLPEPEPVGPRATADEEPVYDDWLERTAREFDRELGRDALPKEEPPPAEEPAAPPKPEPAVVGRYSSGDTNYLMFADGSIEAQTPEGVMRFSSLTELKRFVEKRN